MYAVISREHTQLPPGTVVRMPGTWQDYRTLFDSRGDSAIPRIKYRNGEILLMSPLPKHGREAHLLSRVVELLLDNQNRNYEAFTPSLLNSPKKGALSRITASISTIGKRWLGAIAYNGALIHRLIW